MGGVVCGKLTGGPAYVVLTALETHIDLDEPSEQSRNQID